MLKYRNTRFKSMTSIDMTPLMDLTFMLLIIFVITVPVMEYSTDVTPPELNGQVQMETVVEPLIITMNDMGELSINQEKVALHQLTDRLLQLKEQRGKLDVMVRADGSRPYEDVVAIMRSAQKAGMDSVALMTQAEKK